MGILLIALRPNLGNAYRFNEGVDIEASSEDFTAVGFFEKDEWMAGEGAAAFVEDRLLEVFLSRRWRIVLELIL